MKHVLFCLMMICFLLVSPASAEEWSDNGITQVVFADDCLYAVAGDGIWKKAFDQSDAEKLYSMEELQTQYNMGFPLNIFICREKLGIADWSNRQLYLCENEQPLKIIQISNDISVDPLQMVCIGETEILWVLNVNRLYAINLNSGQVHEIGIHNITEINEHPDGGLILLRRYENKQEILRITSPTDTPQVLAVIGGNDGGIAVDPQNGRLYASIDGMLSFWNDGKWEKLSPYARTVFFQGCAIRKGILHFVTEFRLYTVSLEVKRTVQLSIRGSELWLENDLQFMHEHPNISIYRRNEACSPQDLLTALLSDDTETDLFLVYMSTGLQKLMDKGYLAEIPSDAVYDDFKRFYPFIQQNCMKDGKIFAYPNALSHIEGWRQKNGMSAYTPPRSIEELLALDVREQPDQPSDNMVANAYHQSGWTKNDYARYTMKQWILSQPAGAWKFSDSALETILDKIKQMPERQDIDAEYETENACQAIFNQETSINLLTDAEEMAGGKLILPPAITEENETVIPARMKVYVLNPRSTHKEEALAFLSYQIKNRRTQDEAFMCQDTAASLTAEGNKRIHEAEQMFNEAQTALDLAKPDEKKTAEDNLVQAQVMLEQEKINGRNWMIHPETLRFYQQEYASRISLQVNPLVESEKFGGVRIQLDGLMEQWLQEQMTTEQYLKKLDEIWLLYQKESGKT